MVLQLFAIPIVGVILAIVLSFFCISIAAIVFPQVSAFLFAIAFGILAWFTRDVKIYEGDKWKLSGGLVFGAMAAMVMVASFFNIKLPSFGASIVATSPASFQGDVFNAIKATGAEPMSIITIVTVIVSTLLIVVVADKYILKGKLTKRRR